MNKEAEFKEAKGIERKRNRDSEIKKKVQTYENVTLIAQQWDQSTIQ